MPEHQKRDWLKFWIHFVCGALVGAFVGVLVWSKSSYASSMSMMPGLVFVGGGALLLGVVAGLASNAGDHFWHDIGVWFRWW